MVYSNERKLCLSGWLKVNSETEYNTPLKLQKFLLFYEAFSKVADETSDFSHLCGYKRGPVFSTVWGDYTKEKAMFNTAAVNAYKELGSTINNARAKKCAFMVKTLTENELSELTHKMNIWKRKENRIMNGEHQVGLSESNFNEKDSEMIKMLDMMYSDEIIEQSEVINLDKNYFVFNKKDISKLTEKHFDVLSALVEQEDLMNPVYVEMDGEGRLLID